MTILPAAALKNRVGPDNHSHPWTIESLHALVDGDGTETARRTIERAVSKQGLLPPTLAIADIRDEWDRAPRRWATEHLLAQARKERLVSLFVQQHDTADGIHLIAANDGRQARRWVFLTSAEPDDTELANALQTVCSETGGTPLLWPHGKLCRRVRALVDSDQRIAPDLATALAVYHPVYRPTGSAAANATSRAATPGLSHLDRLEAESIHILREVAATADNPVMLYSVGKDSAVMLHLARKAFHPAPPPFPLLHIDTGWKFQEMIQFRDTMAAEAGMTLLTHTNPEGLAKGINPIDHGSAVHTDIMKTQALKQALDEGQYDVAFGGARRDEEKSRAKERIFSFRTGTHRWDPKNQRPELWNLYNTEISKGESIRVFPISNWTELDVWQYIHREAIPIVPLYFAARRPFVRRDGMIIMLDDDRLEPLDGESVEFKRIRFRTLGCYPLTGGFESEADDLDTVILELLKARNSERLGRAIDTDSAASMEKKKQEGYF
ncbi:MAG: sulfate adenylyltransferase subunit CysD [Alphaproteobacteria bacterium]|nr:sulfate adenylyltransferase subunit CysD [Alphaproteobacteria bacterium]